LSYPQLTLFCRFNDSNGGTDTKNFELRYVGTSSPDIAGLYFRSVNDANSVYTDRMAILGNGNVGIGTISPEAKLHIGGNTASTQRAICTTGVTDPAFKVVARNGVSGATAVQGYIGLALLQRHMASFGGYAIYPKCNIW
jgi:hypothetical protein